MSKITTLYDKFIQRIEAKLPNHLRLSDPYLFLKNTDSEKRQGFGVKIGNGTNTNQQLSCDIILNQELTLVLTRISQGRETDSSKKVEAQKQLLEDLFLVIQDIESEPSMGIPETVIGSSYVSHSGIEFIQGERDDLLKIETVFNFNYREDFN